jgi:protein TonB
VVGGAHVKPWQGLALSLLAALSLHAVILLVPRVPGRGDARAPQIELSLAALPADQSVDETRSLSVRKESPLPFAVPAVVAASTRTSPVPPLTAAEPPPNPRVESMDEPPAFQDHPAAEPDWLPPAREPDEAAASGDPGAAAQRATSGGTAGPGAAAATAATLTVITPPRPRAAMLPIYPRSARKAGLEGTVRIAAFIDESGTVVSAEVLSSSGNAILDQAALQEVQRVIFDPARQSGKPVPFRLIIPFRFRLN